MSEEASRVLRDLDYVLDHDANNPADRERLLELRRTIEHVERTGHFPADQSRNQ